MTRRRRISIGSGIGMQVFQPGVTGSLPAADPNTPSQIAVFIDRTFGLQ
jgi:hypothetical protein